MVIYEENIVEYVQWVVIMKDGSILNEWSKL